MRFSTIPFIRKFIQGHFQPLHYLYILSCLINCSRRQTAAEKHQALWDREQNKNILDSSIDNSKSSRNRITTPKQTTPDKQPRSPGRTVDAEKRPRRSLKRQETSRKLLDFDDFDDQRTFKKTDIFGRHTTLNDSLIKEQALCGEYSKMLSNPLFANLYNNLFWFLSNLSQFPIKISNSVTNKFSVKNVCKS